MPQNPALMLIKIIAAFLVVWFVLNALASYKGNKPLPIKIFGFVTYSFIIVGSIYLFLRHPSAQWILKTSSILFMILLLLSGSLEYFANWFAINQDKIPALKDAMSEVNLTEEQQRKYQLLQDLKAKKESGEDISVQSRSALNQLIDEFEIDPEAKEMDIDPEEVFDMLNAGSEFDSMVNVRGKKEIAHDCNHVFSHDHIDYPVCFFISEANRLLTC